MPLLIVLFYLDLTQILLLFLQILSEGQNGCSNLEIRTMLTSAVELERSRFDRYESLCHDQFFQSVQPMFGL